LNRSFSEIVMQCVVLSVPALQAVCPTLLDQFCILGQLSAYPAPVSSNTSLNKVVMFVRSIFHNCWAEFS